MLPRRASCRLYSPSFVRKETFAGSSARPAPMLSSQTSSRLREPRSHPPRPLIHHPQPRLPDRRYHPLRRLCRQAHRRHQHHHRRRRRPHRALRLQGLLRRHRPCQHLRRHRPRLRRRCLRRSWLTCPQERRSNSTRRCWSTGCTSCCAAQGRARHSMGRELPAWPTSARAVASLSTTCTLKTAESPRAPVAVHSSREAPRFSFSKTAPRCETAILTAIQSRRSPGRSTRALPRRWVAAADLQRSMAAMSRCVSALLA